MKCHGSLATASLTHISSAGVNRKAEPFWAFASSQRQLMFHCTSVQADLERRETHNWHLIAQRLTIQKARFNGTIQRWHLITQTRSHITSQHIGVGFD